MKQIAYIVLFLLLPATLMAQAKESGERIRTIKIGYISERLHLNADQAKKFWPVYNKYQDELKAIRKEFKQKYKITNPGSSEQMAREFVADNLEYKQAELNLQRRYKDEMLKIITPQQLATLYQAERDFKTILLKQLRENKRKMDKAAIKPD